ncbi:MAG: UDP-N-acetylmuramate dehydrogenase [Anaerolineae bacterium]|nr:UDP-N-acetylmuramate dehydrogenase [Anaerolineae bacterium]MDH7473390.1 UDP-N-acetylmuramate dehydrogenase [Anaerolineae bacterium]
MEFESLKAALQRRWGDRLLTDEPMSEHTSYHIGGPADLYLIAESGDELAQMVALAAEYDVPVFVMGRGTNILVADAGIRGLVIELRAGQVRYTSNDETVVWAEAGANLRDIARESVARGLAGLDWAVGIPGSVGGAVVGNAGAFGGYMSDVVRRLTILDANGVREISAAEAEFDYRMSRFKAGSVTSRGRKEVILAAEMVLRPEPVAALKERVAEYIRRREERQPVEPSAGSVFKRTAQYPAGFLIEQAGLKGIRRGEAMISPRHANFIVNLGRARAADVKALIELAQERVLREFGERLELEIELIGDWD